MVCPKCSQKVLPHERRCAGCEHDCGFPNVRAADLPAETAALKSRLMAQEVLAAARGTVDELSRLRAAALKTKAVRARSLQDVYRLVQNDNQLMATFVNLKGAGLVRPGHNEIDKARKVSESLLFFEYEENIHFAALALGDRGLFSYGDCVMVLDDQMIEDRATVFEENCVFFCRRQNIGAAKTEIPPGFRATWSRRDELVAAKLGDRLVLGMTENDFSHVLLKTGATPSDDEFIEVHIYGSLNRSALHSVLIKSGRRRSDRSLLKNMEKVLGPGKVRQI
jgi:hypothetical protein